ncbi:MAG: class IV adenylate cyclase [Myxococcales bacterium]|nr:class IV adenylate cyclase [Myxococcales bacterium]
MLEVELKSRVRSLSDIRRQVARLGGVRVGKQIERDVYYRHPGRDFGLTGEALRVRSAGQESFVTYKGPRQPGIAKTRPEVQVTVGSARLMSNILQKLGFRVFGRVRKRRETYTLSGITVCLDQVEGLGSFVELEIIGTDRTAAQRRLLALARKLSLSGFLRESYLSMWLSRQKRARRQGACRQPGLDAGAASCDGARRAISFSRSANE